MNNSEILGSQQGASNLFSVRLIFAAVIAIGLSCFLYPISLYTLDIHHDGLMLKTALDLVAGKKMFLETFNQYGPVSSIFHVVFMKAFGPSITALKLGTCICYGLSGAFLFLIWSRFLSLPLSIVAIFVWIGFGHFFDPAWAILPWSSTYALLLQSIGIFLIVWFPLRSARSLISLAILALFMTLCRFPVGVTFSAAAIISFSLDYRDSKASDRLRRICLFGFSYALGMALFFLYLRTSGRYELWHHQVVEIPANWLKGMRAAYPHLMRNALFWKFTIGVKTLMLLLLFPITALLLTKKSPPLTAKSGWIIALLISVLFFAYPELSDRLGGWASAIPLMMVICFGVLFGLSTLFPKWRAKLTEKDLLFFLALPFVIASWSQYFPVTCQRHIFWAVSPALGFLIYVLFRFYRFTPRTSVIICLIVFAPLWRDATRRVIARVSGNYLTLQEPAFLRGMHVSPGDYRQIQEFNALILDYARKRPSFTIMLQSPDSLWATFATDMENPDPVFVAWGTEGEAGESRRREFVQRKHPLIVVQPSNTPTTQAFCNLYGYKVLGVIQDGPTLLAPI